MTMQALLAIKKYFMRLKKTGFLVMLLSLLFAGNLSAQQAAPAVKAGGTFSNMVPIMMLIIALVLAFVIYAMGQVLITLIRQVLDKRGGTIFSVILVVVCSLLPAVSGAQDAGTVVVKVANNYGGLSATGFWSFVSVIGIEIIAILFLLFFIKRIQDELQPQPEKSAAPTTDRLKKWWIKTNNKFFTRAVPVAKEADILLDHDYDGIKELDNSLPPWWSWGFVLTIIFSVVYLLHFHVLGSGKNPTEEYQAAMQKAAVELEAYNAKNMDRIDELHLKMSTAGGITEGNEIFQQVCWACHGKEGEGGAGPNLTDDYWMHKGSLADVYHSIKTGYPDKGMQAWEKQYTPKQINNLASFIKTLKGKKPANAKAPEGEFYEETIEEADSSVVKKEMSAGN